MKIESMAGYPSTMRLQNREEEQNYPIHVQSHLATFNERIQELAISKVVKPQVWCTGCHMEGHHILECPRFRGAGPSNLLIEPPPVRPTGGVAQVATSTPFHGPVQYHAFPNNQALLTNEYYEIFRTHGHPPRHCPILQKYSSATNTLYCELCGSSTHAWYRKMSDSGCPCR